MENDAKDEALELLHSLKHISDMIERLQEQIDKTYSMLTSTTIKPKVVDVQTSAPTDQLADRMADIIEWQDALIGYQKELCAKKKVALAVMKLMEYKQQRLLCFRYIDGLTIEATGKKLGISYATAWEELHNAEKKFSELYATDRII